MVERVWHEYVRWGTHKLGTCSATCLVEPIPRAVPGQRLDEGGIALAFGAQPVEHGGEHTRGLGIERCDQAERVGDAARAPIIVLVLVRVLRVGVVNLVHNLEIGFVTISGRRESRERRGHRRPSLGVWLPRPTRRLLRVDRRHEVLLTHRSLFSDLLQQVDQPLGAFSQAEPSAARRRAEGEREEGARWPLYLRVPRVRLAPEGVRSARDREQVGNGARVFHLGERRDHSEMDPR